MTTDKPKYTISASLIEIMQDCLQENMFSECGEYNNDGVIEALRLLEGEIKNQTPKEGPTFLSLGEAIQAMMKGRMVEFSDSTVKMSLPAGTSYDQKFRVLVKRGLDTRLEEWTFGDIRRSFHNSRFRVVES